MCHFNLLFTIAIIEHEKLFKIKENICSVKIRIKNNYFTLLTTLTLWFINYSDHYLLLDIVLIFLTIILIFDCINLSLHYNYSK